MARESSKAPTGVVIVDKPRGPTSHDVVAQARRLYGTRRIGHAGTLDPDATGVLVLMVGEASKLSAHLSGQDKEYTARVSFGVATDTLDAEGRVTEQVELPPGWLETEALDAAVDAERQRRAQRPPSFSAIKTGGVVAHRAARRGESLELPDRDVHVHSLRAVEWSDTHVSLELRVSKGYYVRSLARDLGGRLGIPAHLKALRRTSSGAFSLREACPWPPAGEPPEPLALADAARRCLPSAQLTELGLARARTGKLLNPDHFTTLPNLEHAATTLPFAWLFGDELVALGWLHEGSYRVLRGFNANS